MFGLITAPLLLAGVVVLGEGRDGCPDAREVSERLEPLLADEPAGPPDALIFDGEGGGLRVRLLSPEGDVREQKTLELVGACDELADAVATLAVAWRSRLQSAPVAPPVLAVALEEPFAPVEQVHEREEPAPEPALRQHDFELSVGLETQTGVERWAPAMVVGAQLPVSGPYNFGLTFDLSPRTAIDPRLERWTWLQLNFVAGVWRRMVTQNLHVDGQLGLGAGMNITLNAENQLQRSRTRKVFPTLVTGVRWTYRHAQGLPWFGITWSLVLDPEPASVVESTNIPAETWWLGLALGGTLTLDEGL